MSSFNCSSCNAANASNARFCTNCGASLTIRQANPYDTPNSQSTAAMVSAYAFAGFWKRLIARLLDSIIFSILFFILAFVLGATSFSSAMDPTDGVGVILGIYALFFPSWWLYFALMESSSSQATLGKKLLGIKVTDIYGQPIGFGQATGRHFAGFISYITFSIGYLMAAFTSRKQALHDMIASTLVVNARYGPSQIKVASENPGTGMSVGGIIAIVFLVLLIPIAGILAAIAIPAYQDYTIRARVHQALAETSHIQPAITAHATETGYWPNTLQQAGIDEELINNEFYQVKIETDGAYQVIFKQPTIIFDKRLNFVPQLSVSGDYEWKCGSNDLKTTYLPSQCKNIDL